MKCSPYSICTWNENRSIYFPYQLELGFLPNQLNINLILCYLCKRWNQKILIKYFLSVRIQMSFSLASSYSFLSCSTSSSSSSAPNNGSTFLSLSLTFYTCNPFWNHNAFSLLPFAFCHIQLVNKLNGKKMKKMPCHRLKSTTEIIIQPHLPLLIVVPEPKGSTGSRLELFHCLADNGIRHNNNNNKRNNVEMKMVQGRVFVSPSSTATV